MAQKRFSQGKLAWWPTAKTSTVSVRASEFQILLAQGDPIKAAILKDWKCIASYAANDDNRGNIPGRIIVKENGMIKVLTGKGILLLSSLHYHEEEERNAADFPISVKDTFGK